MRVVTLNANGLRSAARKGLFRWFARQKADVLCVQELKAQPEHLAGAPFEPRGYERFCLHASRPGYSGVALYTRERPKQVIHGLGLPEFDAEGRYVEAVFEDFALMSVYFPSGSSGELRQQVKYRFLAMFDEHVAKLRRRGIPYILCGDINIAHKPIDLKNWRANQKNSGFLPEERAWMDRLLADGGLVDAFRTVNPEPEHYTWWSNRGRAWEKNVGWRIDYQLVTPELAAAVRGVSIYKRRRFSDHAPLVIDYDWRR